MLTSANIKDPPILMPSRTSEWQETILVEGVASYTTRSTNQSTVSRPMRVLHSANKIYSQAIVPDNRLRFSGRNLIDIELLLAAHPSGRSSKYDYLSLTYLNKSYSQTHIIIFILLTLMISSDNVAAFFPSLFEEFHNKSL